MHLELRTAILKKCSPTWSYLYRRTSDALIRNSLYCTIFVQRWNVFNCSLQLPGDLCKFLYFCQYVITLGLRRKTAVAGALLVLTVTCAHQITPFLWWGANQDFWVFH